MDRSSDRRRRAPSLMVLVVFAALVSSAARTEAQVAPARKLRVAVIGQTDSATLRVAETIRVSLAGAPEGPGVHVVPAQDIALVVEHAIRGPNDAISVGDMRQIGLLIKADVLVALAADTLQRPFGTVASLAIANGPSRVIGSWTSRQMAVVAQEVVSAIRSDAAYLRAARP